ncbi:hypothetical protein AALP_AA8G088600 [Arabis alpina]|uniref:J domain-containing protein n=1 Tax=Arabis alpina TaxID=50452 RepID=A0A087G5V4_ARAAL|nr:hypothetical protein AALP_AA8G088600 [Arabis alpina]
MIGDGDGDGDGSGSRIAEAAQSLTASEKLLASGDFEGAKKLAIRACEADPSRADASDYILAITDTLLAGESKIGDSKLPDWYTVLRLIRLTQNPEHIAVQYRRLTLLLNPTEINVRPRVKNEPNRKYSVSVAEARVFRSR